MVGKIFGCLFGLFFSAVGCLIAYDSIVPALADWYAMRDWQTAGAKLETVSGGDNYVKASYRYQISGTSYQGDRVYVNQFNDNIGSYHKQLYQRLRQARDSGNTISISIDPDDPSKAVIDSGMRWGLFTLMAAFCGVFVAVGLSAIYFSLRHRPNSAALSPQRVAKLQRQWQRFNDLRADKLSFEDYVTQHTPSLSNQINTSPYTSGVWQQRKGWQTNRIRSDARAGALGMWLFAIFWSGVSSPVLFHLQEEIRQGNYAILIALLFPLIGLGLLYSAIRKTLEYLRFGVIELVMDPYPGSIGGHVGGSLEINKLQYDDPAINSAKFKITLECVYSYVSGSGKNRSRREDIKWAEEGQAQVSRSAFGILLTFRFDVPDYLPEASEPRGSEYYFWRLSVQADLPGADLNRHYTIPVFKTGRHSSNVKHDISAQVTENRLQQSQNKASAIARGDFHLTDLGKVVKVQDSGGELRLHFPIFRNLVLTLFAAVFGLGFSFAVYGINEGFSSSSWSIFSFLFSIPFALVALCGNLALIYLPFNNLTVHISGNSLRVVRRWLFIPIAKADWSFSEVNRLLTKRSGSSGEGMKKVEYFTIHAYHINGKRITLAEGVIGEDLANHLKDYLAKRMGKNG